MIPTSNRVWPPSKLHLFHIDEKDLISEGCSLSLTSSRSIGELKAA